MPGISDHLIVVVYCDVKPRYNKQKYRKLHIYNTANWIDIKTNLRALSMCITYSPITAEIKWQDLRDGISKAMLHDIHTKWLNNRYRLFLS